MPKESNITPELKTRIETTASKTGLTPAEIVSDALENGHSLEWQERFHKKVADGIAAADQQDFATDAELDRLRNKYRSA